MGRLSKITLPNNDMYELGVRYDNILPIKDKTFENLYGTATNFNDATFYYGSIRPNDYYSHWHVKFKIQVIAAGDERAKSQADVMICGIQDILTATMSWNRSVNSSYYPYYTHVLYRLNTNGYDNGLGHLIGLRLYSSWNYNKSANYRIASVEIYEASNCEFTFLDQASKYSEISGSGTTNYSGYTEIDSRTNGLQETGDLNSNNYDRLYMQYVQPYAGSNNVYRNSLVMQKPDGTWESIVLSAGTANKNVNTSGFLWDTILYNNLTSTVTSGKALTNALYGAAGFLIDGRYSFNNLATTSASEWTGRKPLYLVGQIVNNLFYLDTEKWFSEVLPSTDDSKAYILLGYTYDTYRYTLLPNHPVFMYKNGANRTIESYSLSVSTDSSLSVEGAAADAKAVGDLKEDLFYEPISLLDFSLNPAVAEIGSVIQNVEVSYTLNKVPTLATLNGDSLPAAASDTDDWLFPSGLNTETEFTLFARDNGSPSRSPATLNVTKTLYFWNRVYWGTKADGTVDSAFIRALLNSELSVSKSRSITVTPGSKEYIWYAYPARLGTASFTSGGFVGGFESPETVSVTNASGYTEDYYVYRSTNLNLGETTVVIT